MDHRTDTDLLRAYAERRSEKAFAELVRRHVDLVYSAARRMVVDSHLAEDVTQAVFVALARSAQELNGRAILSGWLHRTAQNIAAQTVRTDVRRRVREREAAAMDRLLADECDATWEHIAPHLDTAISELSEPDRDALMLRYFERKSAREMALDLGISAEAAQKRVSRAVERLRDSFAKRGVTVGASGLVAVISAHAVQSAPVGLSVSISTAAVLAGGAISASASAASIKTMAMTTLQKTIAGALVAVGVTIPLAFQHQAQVKLRDENQALRQRNDELARLLSESGSGYASGNRSVLPRPPTGRLQAVAAPAEPSAEDGPATNLVARLLQLRDRERLLQLREGEPPPKLTAAQVETYLKENGRNAASLLAAFRATGEQALLQEALQKYPDDAPVNFSALFTKGISPAERRQRLEALKRAAPANALAGYLSAREYFKNGQADRAVEEINATTGQIQFQDYASDFVQDDEEAWRSAGYSVAEAKTAASMLSLLPHLGEMKQLSYDLVSLAGAYRQAGDEPSAQAALLADLKLGLRFEGAPGQALVDQLVGMAIQGMALHAMDPGSAYGTDGQTVKGQLDVLTAQRGQIKALVQQFDAAQQRMSNEDWISYKDRWRSFGEEAALRWMVAKHGPGSSSSAR